MTFLTYVGLMLSIHIVRAETNHFKRPLTHAIPTLFWPHRDGSHLEIRHSKPPFSHALSHLCFPYTLAGA